MIRRQWLIIPGRWARLYTMTYDETTLDRFPIVQLVTANRSTIQGSEYILKHLKISPDKDLCSNVKDLSVFDSDQTFKIFIQIVNKFKL